MPDFADAIASPTAKGSMVASAGMKSVQDGGVSKVAAAVPPVARAAKLLKARATVRLHVYDDALVAIGGP
jgi:hypothetical protein